MIYVAFSCSILCGGAAGKRGAAGDVKGQGEAVRGKAAGACLEEVQ